MVRQAKDMSRIILTRLARGWQVEGMNTFLARVLVVQGRFLGPKPLSVGSLDGLE